jgi:hypothetical protein
MPIAITSIPMEEMFVECISQRESEKKHKALTTRNDLILEMNKLNNLVKKHNKHWIASKNNY